MLPRAYRLRSRQTIEGVRQEGRVTKNHLLVLICRPNSFLPAPRFAFSVSKRMGNAVIRNYIKRHLREAVRPALPDIAPQWDCVFIARAALASAEPKEMRVAVLALLQRAKLLKARNEP